MSEFALWALAGIGAFFSVVILVALIGDYVVKITRMRCDKIIRQANEIIDQEKWNRNAGYRRWGGK